MKTDFVTSALSIQKWRKSSDATSSIVDDPPVANIDVSLNWQSWKPRNNLDQSDFCSPQAIYALNILRPSGRTDWPWEFQIQDSTSTKGTAQGFDQYGFALFPISLE